VLRESGATLAEVLTLTLKKEGIPLHGSHKEDSRIAESFVHLALST